MNTSDNQQEELACADDVAEPPSGGVKRSPGNMLRAQRETLELSVQQVSEQLNLTMHYLRCLESDSYDKLPGDVFVRGYIRTYSRLLRLDPDQVLMIYDEYNSHKIARKEEAIKRRNRRIKDRNRPWIIISGVAFVTVAVALWYLSPGQSADSPGAGGEVDVVLESAASVLAASTSRVTPAANEPAIDVVADVLRETGTQPQADASVASGAISAEPAPSVEQAALPSLPDVMPDETAQAQLSAQMPASTQVPGHTQMPTTDLAAPAVADTGLADTGVADTGVANTGTAIVQTWAGNDELTLHFKNESWVEVEHNGGAEEHADTRHAGETLTIYGTAPFAVLLGNARDVELSFNGRVIDISSNIRADNTARLSIGM